MDENKIREIVRDEIDKNYRFGAPQVPPHNHDGVSNSRISLLGIIGVNPVPSSQTKYLNSSGVYEYGYGSQLELSPASSGHSAQYLNNSLAVSIPIPIVVGNGVGAQSAFNGGYAPDGTVVMFANGLTLSTLNIRFDGQWYKINFDAVI